MNWLSIASRSKLRALSAGALALFGTGGLLGLSNMAPSGAEARVAPVPAISGHIDLHTLSFPPNTSYCLQNFGFHCYQPFQFQKAYDLQPLYARGLNGAGRTIDGTRGQHPPCRDTCK